MNIKNKKISTLSGIIIIVAWAIIALGGVFAYQYFTKSQTAGLPVQSQQATESWKTYTNDGYGFEIKYPETGDSGINDSGMNTTESYSNIMVVIRPKSDNNEGSFVTIDIDNSKQILEKCFKHEPYASSKTSPDMKYKKQINGVVFYTNSQNESEQIQFSAIHNNNCYLISAYGNQDKDTKKNIISTFKFTK